MASWTRGAAQLAGLLIALGCCGCGREPAGGGLVLEAWAHSGREGERLAIQRHVSAFNAARDDVTIELTLIPEGAYNRQVQEAAALADDLPDLLEFDGPLVTNYAWQGHLRPLDDLLSAGTLSRLIASIVAQGRYRDALYSVGLFDSGLAIYGRRSLLEAAGVRVPALVRDAWSTDELTQALTRLAERDPDGQVLDLKLNYTGEWTTYAFSPIIQSAGGDLVARSGGGARGVLDGPAAVGAMRQLQRWIADGFVDPNLDDQAFVAGRVALSWVGHWEHERYRAAHGADLVLVPLPDFGQGSRTGQGSWNWGITRRCTAPAEAAAFLEFLLEDAQILEVTGTNAAIPATTTAIASSPLHQPGGPLHLFVLQLTGGAAVPRPRTPAYPVITAAFQQAFDDLRHGADVEAALRRAAQVIDQDIRDNQGYRAADVSDR